MAKRGFAIAFLIVLLAAGAGAFFGARYLLRTFQSRAASGSAWVPPDQRTATAVAAVDPAADVAAPPTAQVPAARPADFTPDLSRVTVVPLASPTPTAFPTVAVARVQTRIVPAVETATPTPTATPAPPSTEYVAAG